LLGSVAVIVAALAIWFTGWMPVDPLLSALVSPGDHPEAVTQGTK